MTRKSYNIIYMYCILNECNNIFQIESRVHDHTLEGFQGGKRKREKH